MQLWGMKEEPIKDTLKDTSEMEKSKAYIPADMIQCLQNVVVSNMRFKLMITVVNSGYQG